MGFMYDAAYFARAEYAQAKAHGAVALSHYLTRGYEYTSPQVAATRADGLGALHNMEGYAAELKGASRAKGRAFAEEALSAVGRDVPRDGTVSVVYSVDTDLTALNVCDQAFYGINDVHRSSVGRGIKAAVYSEGGLIIRLHGMGLVQGKQWLSMSEGFGGFFSALNSGLVGIVQMHDAAGQWIGSDIGGTDRNTVIDPVNSGIWWPAGSPYVKPAAVAQEVHHMPVVPELFVVDLAECRRKHKTWFGWGLDFFDGHPRHIATAGELDYRRKVQGLKPRKISLAQFAAIGGK